MSRREMPSLEPKSVNENMPGKEDAKQKPLFLHTMEELLPSVLAVGRKSMNFFVFIILMVEEINKEKD
jgi:hypothetical protein